MIGAVSQAQSNMVDQQIGPKNGAESLGPAASAFKKAEGLQKSIASIVTEHQPLNTSGNLGRNVNIVT